MSKGIVLLSDSEDLHIMGPWDRGFARCPRKVDLAAGLGISG